MKTLFFKSSEFKFSDWFNYQVNIKWKWLQIINIKIEKAILICSPKTAPGPDSISFAIIQQAFKAIP